MALNYGIFSFMNVRKPLLLIFLIAIVSFFLFSEIDGLIHGLEKEKEDSYAQNKINLQTILDIQKQSTRTTATQLANDSIVKRAYLENNPQLIINHLVSFWNEARKQDLVYEIHFFKPPAISFVNFSNFDSIGKDVSRVRKDIAWITSSFKNSSHLMMCKTYAGIRATYPILDDEGNILGGVSLGKKVDWIPDTLKKTTKKDAFLVYTDSSAQSLAPTFYERFLENKFKVNGYILADRTIEIEPELINRIDFSSAIQDIEIGRKKYSLNIYPLYDFEHKPIAYVTVLNNLDAFYQTFYTRLGKDLLVLLTIFLLLHLFVRQNVYKYLQRVASVQALARAYTVKDFSSITKDEEALTCELKEGDEIDQLNKDVLLMGVVLREYYNSLEDEVDEKTAELKVSNARLTHQLYTNPITKLPNRKAFFKDLNVITSPQLAVLNVNRFKIINDVYGVEVGNKLLVDLAKLIIDGCDKFRTYHLGADEFALLGDSTLDNTFFENAVSKLLNTIESHAFSVNKEKVELNMAVYAGISFEREYTMESADIALGTAKQMHLPYVIHDEQLGLKQVHDNNIRLMKKIKDALSQGDMKVYYQPIVDADEKIVKYESLIRMIDGEKVLTPYHFLELAKKSQYYQGITRTVIKESFKKFRDKEVSFSVNINADDIVNEKTADYIIDALAGYEKKSNVVFEIVETESIKNFKAVQNFIDRVKSMGAKIAIDDFGSGYSNFSYLLELRPDYLKIDGSLIRNINTDESAFTVVKTIVEFSKSLGIKTVAEFIHSKEVFDLVKSLGVDEFQGYYFSEPKSDIES